MSNRSHVVAFFLMAGCSVSNVTFTPTGVDAGGQDSGSQDSGSTQDGPTIRVTKSGEGTVTSSPAGIDCGATCSQRFPEGTSVTLTATPSDGFLFAGWSGACTGTGTCVVDASGSAGIDVAAMFSPAVTLQVVLAGDATGTVLSSPSGISCGPTCSARFAPGSTVTLTAMPTGTSSFAGWSSAECPGVTPTCMQVLSSDTTAITATFTTRGSATFTTSGNFTVPPGVASVRVLAVGGGGGGANGHQGGGGSGRVATGTFPVSAGSVVAVTVGGFGLGAIACNGCNDIVGNTPGGASSFGTLLSAAGGLTPTAGDGGKGGNGGSGGGGSCNAGPVGGDGATAGGNGGACTSAGGTGQGSFVAALTEFTVHAVTAASGGAGGRSSNAGGGGGGGVFLDGAGPSGANGAVGFSAKGGGGYGGGGGAGGYDQSGALRIAGGNGAPGVVYLEW